MAFNIKHLLVVFLYVCVGFTALANVDFPYALAIVHWLTLGTFVWSAYSVWSCLGETRAFHVGFCSWGIGYFLIFVISRGDWGGMDYVIDALELLFLPAGIAEMTWVQIAFGRAGQCLLSLLFGLIGGCVTVYYYRKRQRMRETIS